MARIVITIFMGFVLSCFALDAKSREVILGEKAYSQGSFDSAKQHFEQAIQNGDESGEPRLYIGLILEARRQYAESIPYFRAAAERPLQKKLRNVALWKLVILYRQARLYPEALRYVERLEESGVKSETFEKIRSEAESFSSTAGVGLKGYEDVKRATKLEKEFFASEKSTESTADKSAIGHAAIEAFNHAIQQDARWKEYRWNIARLHEKLHEKREAEAVYQEIWDDSSNPNAAYKLGFIARRRGEWRQALKHFANALSQTIEDPQLKFFIRYNAAQSHYALGNSKDSFAHAKIAKRLMQEIEVSPKTQAGFKRIYCLGKVSQGEIDNEYCKFRRKKENPLFMNLYLMKLALAKNEKTKAADLAAKIFETGDIDQDENTAKLPAYSLSDLPVAIGILFEAEKYKDVLELTDRFQKDLASLKDYHAWRAVSYFALKEYAPASLEFDKIATLTPSQMNLHLIAMAHVGDYAGIKLKARVYLRNPQAREKLKRNFRKLKIYEPLRQESDFETWLKGAETEDAPIDSKTRPQP